MKGYVQWNMFYKRVILWKQGLKQRQNKELKTVECVQVFWARLACFGQLGLISDPQIFSKLKNIISDPKGLENKIYIMMKDMETFYGDHTSQSSAVVNSICSLERLSVYGWEDFASSGILTQSTRSVGQRLNHWATTKHKICYCKTFISINVNWFNFAKSQSISAQSIMLVGRSFGLMALWDSISVYIGPSSRGREKEVRADRWEKTNIETTSTRTYCQRSRPLPYFNPKQ